MDKNKVLHMDDSVNSIIADKIEEKFEKLSHTTEEKHTFFSMDREFIVRKKVTVSKPNNFGEALEDFCETMKGNVVNPTTSQIFIITSEAHKKQERYHSIIAKRLWIMKHSCPDLEIAVSF